MTTLPIAPPRQRGTQERFVPQASRRIADGLPIHPTSEARLLPYLHDALETTP